MLSSFVIMNFSWFCCCCRRSSLERCCVRHVMVFSSNVVFSFSWHTSPALRLLFLLCCSFFCRGEYYGCHIYFMFWDDIFCFIYIICYWWCYYETLYHVLKKIETRVLLARVRWEMWLEGPAFKIFLGGGKYLWLRISRRAYLHKSLLYTSFDQSIDCITYVCWSAELIFIGP